MATSAVDICNSALYKIGASRITSLSDNSKAGKYFYDQYDRIRKEVLRSHPWNFAISFIELAATVNTPVWEDWTKEFLLPADVLRVLETDLVPEDPWEIGHNVDGNKVIFCNSDTIKIKYIKDITNTTRFEATFEEALAFRLAADAAYHMMQSATLQNQMYKYYELAVSKAMSFDAQEKSQDYIEADEFTKIRG